MPRTASRARSSRAATRSTACSSSADGVHNSTRLNCAASGEADLPALWQQLASEHGVDLVSCVSSALRRGIVDEREAARHARGAASLREGFELSGLGQLVEACIRSDRILDFGG